MRRSPAGRLGPRLARALLSFAVAFALGLPAPAAAEVPAELEGSPIEAVVVDGEPGDHVDTNALGVAPGTPLSREVLRALLAKVMASGLWLSAAVEAEPTASGVRLHLVLAPRLVVHRIDVRGHDALGREDVLRLLDVAERAETEASSLEAGAARVRETYRAMGYERAQVEVLLRDTNKLAEKVVVVNISEGAPERVRRVQFDGSAPPPGSEPGVAFRALVGEVWDEKRVEESLAAIALLLRKQGYLEATVTAAPRARASAPGVLTVRLHMGPRYALRLGVTAPFAPSDVEAALALDAEPLGPAVLESARERVVELYRRRGFRDARVQITHEPAREAPREGAARASALSAQLSGAEAERTPASNGAEQYLVVHIAPGVQEQVVRVAFPGARFYSDEFLEGQIDSYLEEELPGSTFVRPVDSPTADAAGAGGARAWRRTEPPPADTDPRRVFYESTYEEAMAHIRELYRSEGFLDARVGPLRLVKLDARRSIVSIAVREGPRTFLESVVVHGEEAETPRELLRASRLRRGMPFSSVAVEEARIAILDHYREEGFYFARVEATASFSSDRTRAGVTFEVFEGYPVQVGEVVVLGAVNTSTTLIRAQLAFEPGDLLTPSALNRSQERLLNLGVFTGVNLLPEDADVPEREKRVVVTVTERPGQFLESTLGFSTGEGVRGGFEYGFRNLFGYAIGVSLRVQLAYQFIFIDPQIEQRFTALSDLDRLERNVTLGFAFPYVPGLPNTKLALNGVLARDNERDFGIEKLGGSLALTWQPIRRLSFTASEDLERNDVRLFVSGSLQDYLNNNTDPRLERLLRIPDGISTIVATRLTGSVDLRDSPFSPTKGAYFAVSGEYARTLKSEQDAAAAEPFLSNFIKLAVTASGYVPLGKAVWATQLRIGRIVHLDDVSRTYPNRAFFMGGIDTMRGYLQDAMIPQDRADQIRRDPALSPNAVFRGGDAFALLRTELRFPIVGDFSGGVFTDVGNHWADPSLLLEGFRVRPTAGAGIRIGTPVGPLAFDYGILLLRRDYLREQFGAFHFSIGLF